MTTTFRKQNHGWNAEPNAPDVEMRMVDDAVVVDFLLNPWQFPRFSEDDRGRLTFHRCRRWRYGPNNDEGWYRGTCRFSGLAPTWGEFYEVTGDLRLDGVNAPRDWIDVGTPHAGSKHFLFYFRDGTFECDAADWRLDVSEAASRAHAVDPGPPPSIVHLDGSAFTDFESFVDHFSERVLLRQHRWNGNLDALNDILRGGFGTPDGFLLVVRNARSARAALSHDAMARWLRETTVTCHPTNRPGVLTRLDAARRGEGPTLFDLLVEIIREHGPGGSESEDGVVLRLEDVAPMPP